MITCLSCGKKISLNVDKCKNCGIEIKNIFICPYCKRTYKENKLCERCRAIAIPIDEYKKIELNYKKGNIFLENGEFDQAIEYYNKGIENFPNNEVLNFQKAVCYMQLEDFEKAMEYLEKVLKINPDSLGANVNKAQYLLLEKKEYEQVSEIIEKIIDYDLEGNITLLKIQMLHLLGKYDEEKKLIDKAIEEFPENDDFLKAKMLSRLNPSDTSNYLIKLHANCYIEEFQEDPLIEWDESNNEKLYTLKSNEEIDDFIDNEFRKTINTDSEEVLIAKAHQFLIEKNADKRLFYLNKALDINPNNINVLTDKIEIALHIKDFEEAEKYLNQIKEINSEDANYMYNKALIFYKKRDLDNAFIYALKALEKDSNHELTLVLLVDIHYDFQDYEKALEYTEKFLEVGKDEILIDELKFARMDLLEKLNGVDDSNLEDTFDDDLDIDFINENHLRYVVWLSDEILKIDPKDEKIIINKGMALLNLEQFDEALKCFDNGLKLNPKNSEFMVKKSQAWALKRNPKKALKLINKAIKINPNDENAHLVNAEILSNLGRYKKAIEACDKVLDLDSSIFSAKMCKINSYAGLEDFNKCSELVDKYLEEYPDNDFLKSVKKDIEEIKMDLNNYE